MYTYAGVAPDLQLAAVGLVIWVVALSIAFGVYLPVLRTPALRTRSRRGRGRLLRGFSPGGRHVERPYRVKLAEDLDHAPVAAHPVGGDAQSAEACIVAPRGLEAARLVALAACERAPTFSVLIVDDNAINRQVLELILDSVGIAHVSVENGLEAVQAMGVCAYDAVLMDLQMPVMDGFEATRRIRQLEAGRSGAPSTIIVVSANCLDEHVAAARQAGADSHLAKPISAGVLIGQVEACAGLSRLAA